MWTKGRGQLLPVCDQLCCDSTPWKQKHTHVHGDLRKQWQVVMDTHNVSLVELRQYRNEHGTEGVQWIHTAGKICTQQEQDDEFNLERRGGGPAPCRMEVSPTTSTSSHCHTRAKVTVGKEKFDYNRNQSLISGCHTRWDDRSTRKYALRSLHRLNGDATGQIRVCFLLELIILVGTALTMVSWAKLPGERPQKPFWIFK